jgi:hypothetical protein
LNGAAEAGAVLTMDPATKRPALRRADDARREIGRLYFVMVPFNGAFQWSW